MNEFLIDIKKNSWPSDYAQRSLLLLSEIALRLLFTVASRSVPRSALFMF
jgi:hypothetical protein